MLKIRILAIAAVSSLALFVATKASAATGYEKTISWWQNLSIQASQYSQTLQEIYAQAEAQTGADKSRLNAEFSKRLGQQFPGSIFYGSMGKLAINNYTTAFFDPQWNIISLSQNFGSLNKTYKLRERTFEIVNGPNRITAQLDPARPKRSQFKAVTIPGITVSAANVWAKKGVRENYPQPLRDILNDAYSGKIAVEDGTRMDELAEEMVDSADTRKYVLETANWLYTNRPKPQASTGHPAMSPFTREGKPSSFFPWYFWPAIIGVGALKLVTTGKRRRLRPRRRPGRSWDSPRDFSMGRGKGAEVPAQKDDWDLGALGENHHPVEEEIAPAPDLPQEWSLEILSALEWKRFETLCADYLQMIGYDPRETRIGADGGIDIWVYKEGIEKPVGIVQCKAWTTYRVGVKPVRELFGVMAAEGIANGKFITSGEFTSEALAFAQGKRLSLVSGEMLLNSIRKLPVERQQALLKKATAGDYRTPTCPQCGVKMKLRQGKDGGREFWACPQFPKCRATLVYKSKTGLLGQACKVAK